MVTNKATATGAVDFGNAEDIYFQHKEINGGGCYGYFSGSRRMIDVIRRGC